MKILCTSPFREEDFLLRLSHRYRYGMTLVSFRHSRKTLTRNSIFYLDKIICIASMLRAIVVRKNRNVSPCPCSRSDRVHYFVFLDKTINSPMD